MEAAFSPLLSLRLLPSPQDYRLNWRLNNACTNDIKRLCGGLCDTNSGQPCGGVVLQCLQVCGPLGSPADVVVAQDNLDMTKLLAC